MMDPIHAIAVEPLLPHLRQRAPESDARSVDVPEDEVTLSPEAKEAAEALPPVEDTEDTGETEDALYPEADSEGDEASEDEEGSSKQQAKEKDKEELSPKERHIVSKLQARDQEVRAHEAAHISAAGGLAKGGANYTFQTGPDGKRYAIGGEVKISSPRSSDPAQQAANAEKMLAAALAPAKPSSQDQAVASRARAMLSRARAAQAKEQLEERQVTPVGEEEEDDWLEQVEPARMGGATAFGPAEHLHSDGCGYCSSSVGKFLTNR